MKQTKEESDTSIKELNEKLKAANTKNTDLIATVKSKDEKIKEMDEIISQSDAKLKSS